MHENAALIAGGSVTRGLAIARGEVDRAVNFCGGMHHAMPDHASGFCVYNDAALAIAAMLGAGVGKVAYVDVDAHQKLSAVARRRSAGVAVVSGIRFVGCADPGGGF